MIITVRGLQPEVDATEAIEVISAGTYLRKGDTHYLSYDEADEDGKLTKNRIKLTEDVIEMVKQGTVTTQMFFAARTETVYLVFDAIWRYDAWHNDEPYCSDRGRRACQGKAALRAGSKRGAYLGM